MDNKSSFGDRLENRDFIFAALLGLVFAGVYSVFSARGFEPSLWGDLAVAAGLRPPQTIIPGVWRLLTKGLLLERVSEALRWCGVAVGGGCVCLAYLVVRQTLATLVRVQEPAEWKTNASIFSALAAAAFGAGDAMLWIVSPLSPDGLRIFVLLLSLFLFLRWLKKVGRWRIFLMMFVSGALAAETPSAFLIPVFCYISYRLLRKAVVNGKFEPEHSLPSLSTLPKWRMFFTFVAGFLVFAGVEVYDFVASGGLAANEWGATDLVFHYATGLGGVLRHAATPIGWGVSLMFLILPLVFALVLFPRLCRDTEPIDFNFGVMLLFAGLLAVVQCSVLPFTRLWSVTFCAAEVRSGFLRCALSFGTALTLALAASCFAQGCRNRFEYHHGRFKAVEPRGFLFRSFVLVLVLLGLSPVAFRVHRPAEDELRAVVGDALAETVLECGDAKFLFTDGRLDAGLELRAALDGRDVKPINLFSGGSKWDQHIRMRHFEEDSSDYDLAKTDASVLLRVWVEERANGMADAATQLGFQAWQRAQKPMPTRSGFVAREKGIDDAEAARGVAAADEIADRIIRVADDYPNAALTPGVRNAASAVSWRISRMARARGDVALADRLDSRNESVKKQLQRYAEYERMRVFLQMTPRESLRLALNKADFTMARRYAATVLKSDPDDPEANFGTGMAYCREDKLKDAEFYLERVLKRRPEEPAVLNNLAMIYLKTGRLEKAREFARRAHELLPASEEVKRTLEDVEKAAAEGAAAEPPSGD